MRGSKSIRNRPNPVASAITERKQVEKGLPHSERFFQSLVENSADVITILDGDGTIRYESPSLERVLGFKLEDVVGESMFDFLHPEDVSKVAEAFAKLIQSPGSTAHIEVQARPEGGAWRTYEVVARNLLDDAAVGGILINFRDITERKQADAVLRESEEKYRTILEDIEDGYYEVDIAGNFTFFNDAMCRINGYSKDEMMGMNNRQYMDKESAKKVYQAFNRVYTTAKHTREFGWEIIRKDGTKRFVEASVSLKRNSEGEPIGFRGIVRDITERKQAEEALHKSEEKLKRYLESTPDAVYVNDLKGTFLYGNRAAETMIGCPREELIGKSFLELDLLPPEYLSKAAQNLELNATGRPTGPDEFELLRKDGSRVFVEISTYPIGKGVETEVIGIARDITERKGMGQQLQLAGRLAAVGELAAGVAHELNNPLAAVQMYAELLNERDDLDEIIRSDVVTIYKEAQRATRITSNLLRFARRHVPEKCLISINEVIEKALELHAYYMRVNNIDLVMELDPDLPMTMADFHQMEQVFVNIINNAEQAMTEAHGRGKLSVKTQRVGKRIKIAFTDDGPGISEKNLKRLFDPFFTTKEVGEGTGLGLSICYGLVQEHGGHMSVRSKPGEGATFVVSIPIVSEDERTAQEADSMQVQGI